MVISRALIVQPYWLNKIYDDNKLLELRSSKTSVRGPIGLIAAGSGVISGTTSIIGCRDRLTPLSARDTFSLHQVSDPDLLSKWNVPWELDGSKRLVDPLPYKHPRGAVIWVKLDPLHVPDQEN